MRAGLERIATGGAEALQICSAGLNDSRCRRTRNVDLFWSFGFVFANAATAATDAIYPRQNKCTAERTARPSRRKKGRIGQPRLRSLHYRQIPNLTMALFGLNIE